MQVTSSASPVRGTGRFVTQREAALLMMLLAMAIVAPFFLFPFFIMKVMCFALFASAYNLLFGYAGLLAFGHAALFGSAAYITAHAARSWGLTPELAILTGTLGATLLGALFGWLAIRRQGLYFAMITLALAQIVYFYALQAPWTYGEDGIQGVPRGYLFGIIDLSNTINMYVVVTVIFLIGFAVIHRVITSPFGEALRAIRDNEPRAISLGYDVDRMKWMAFVISAAFSGLAGGMKAIVFQLASLVDVYFLTSGDVLLMVLIGGIGTVTGPLVGAGILVAMQNYLAPLGSYVLIVQGVIFILCVLIFRKGIVGTAVSLLRRRSKAEERHL
jgi:branched-chain amino acid transport system permease protein